MSGTHHRTWQSYRVGHFSVTIELDPIGENCNFEQHKELAAVATQLVEVMDAHRIKATWAMSDPAHAKLSSKILRSAVAHEFAILGDTSWVGTTAGRTRFAQELSRRVAQARAAGMSVQTIAPRAAIGAHIDLVVKQQIVAISGMNFTPPAPTTTAPRAVHYGVWEMPISGRVPTKRTWFSNGGWSLWRRVRKAAKDAAAFHLMIDAAAFTGESRNSLQTLDWLVRRVANLRDRGLVRVETLKATAERLSDVPAVKPQRSILLRAA